MTTKLPQDTWLHKADVWAIPDAGEQVTYAIRALAEGKANEGQQRLVWDWLSYVTMTGYWTDNSFRPGGEDGRRSTDFAEGRRFVGVHLRRHLGPALTPRPKPEPTK